jgi:hypothetical protein
VQGEQDSSGILPNHSENIAEIERKLEFRIALAHINRYFPPENWPGLGEASFEGLGQGHFELLNKITGVLMNREVDHLDIAKSLVRKFVLSTTQTTIGEAQVVRPIAELWDEAFEKLKNDEKDLVQDYQRVLNRDKSLTSVFGSTSLLTGFKAPRKLQMRAVLQRKIDDVKSTEWKLKFKGHELAVKQLVEPVTSIVEWAEDCVGQALEASVYESLAWFGVCLLLPVSYSFCLDKL